jgi:ribonuclease HI
VADGLKEVTIYTDGAAEPNPGPGGYGVVLLFGGHRKELSGGFRRTTNNRMELRAAVVALEALKALCAVTLHSDSKYLVEAMSQGWVEKWRAKEFLKKGVPMSNADLWKRLAELCDLHRVRFAWVKGHAGDVENERCDALAMAALLEKDLPADEGYEEEREFAEERGFDVEGEGRAAKKGDMQEEGQPCRKCGVAVEKRVPKKRGKGEWYYAWYLYCPGCGTNYMVEGGKRFERH